MTGGGSGIGRLMCLRFARLGASVVTWDVNKAGNEETVALVKREGNKATAFTVDMTKRSFERHLKGACYFVVYREDIYKMAQETKEKVGPVSILVNNAGIVSGTALLDTSDEKIIRTFDVNIMAHFWTIKAFLPDMISKRQVPGCVLQTVTVYLNSFLISSRASNPIMIKIFRAI